MKLSFSSKDEHVPNPKEGGSRWIASLSDGTTVFEDIAPGQKSAWLRLCEYVEKHKLKVTNLRLESYGRQVILVPYKDASGEPQLNGYWHSKRLQALLGGPGGQYSEVGIGYLKAKEIVITWVGQDGLVRQELREYKPGDLAVIVNNPPA